jgi:hypothetical protein
VLPPTIEIAMAFPLGGYLMPSVLSRLIRFAAPLLIVQVAKSLTGLFSFDIERACMRESRVQPLISKRWRDRDPPPSNQSVSEQTSTS